MKLFLQILILLLVVGCNAGGGSGPAVATEAPTEGSPPLPESTHTVEATAEIAGPATAPATAPATTETVETATETAAPASPTAGATATEAAAEASAALPEEAILILEPGPGSRITSPLRVAGISNSTFEQNLGVRIVLADGTEIALVPATIQSELGERGPFEVEIPFEVTGEQQAFIQVYEDSARDGGLLHLSSVGVTLADSGAAEIVPVPTRAEQILIEQPVQGQRIEGGTVHVEGVATASFEQTLVVDVLDVDGNTLARQSILLEGELGQPGRFSVDIPYTVTTEGPGRIVVRDESPAFGGTAHLESVEVTIGP